MKTKHIDIEKVRRDLSATKTVGKGKNAEMVPDMRVRLRSLEKFLRWRFGPARQMTLAEMPAVFAAIYGTPGAP